MSKLNSLSSLSCKTSIWSKPKKPILKPNPNAFEVSGSQIIEESDKLIFSKASFKSL